MPYITTKIQIPDQPLWLTKKVKLTPVRNWRKMTELRLHYVADGEIFTADGVLLNATLTIDTRLDIVTNQVQGLFDGLESGSALIPVAPSHGGSVPKTMKVPDATGKIIEIIAIDSDGYPVPIDDPASVVKPISHWTVERLVPIHMNMGLALSNIVVTPKTNPNTDDLVFTENRTTGALVQWVYVNASPDVKLVTRARVVTNSVAMRSGISSGPGARVVQFV